MHDIPKPRWAAGYSDETWERINELIEIGYSAAEIIVECELSPRSERSLQLYIGKLGPRLRLKTWASMKDAMLRVAAGEGGNSAFTAALAAAMAKLAQQVVSDKTPLSTQTKALEVMTKFTALMNNMLVADSDTEKARIEREAASKLGAVSPEDVAAKIAAIYGIKPA